jgi:hypothetical protein
VKWIFKNGREKMPVWSAKMDEIIQIPTNPLISLRYLSLFVCLFISFFIKFNRNIFKVKKKHNRIHKKGTKKDHWTLSVFAIKKKCLILFYVSFFTSV